MVPVATQKIHNVTTQMSDSLLEFPCDFPLKVMGVATDDFDELVVATVRRHVSDLSEGSIRAKKSRNGKYVSITVTIQIRSQEQLDAIYAELSSNERILMVL